MANVSYAYGKWVTMSSESSVSDDFRPLIQLASDALQDAVSLAGLVTMGNERIRIKSENITSKLISMISLLSQISIEHANKLKQYHKIERKSVKYIEELRNYVINQGTEIDKLQAQITSQNAASKAPCVTQVDSGMNTDGPTIEFLMSSVKARFEEESSKLLDEISILRKAIGTLKNENKTLQKDLNKANMMLQTQQIFLEECEDKRYDHIPIEERYDHDSIQRSSRGRNNTFQYENEKKRLQESTITQRLRIKQPSQSNTVVNLQQEDNEHQVDAIHRAVSKLSLPSNHIQNEVSRQKADVGLSSPSKMLNSTRSRYVQQLDASIDYDHDIGQEIVVTTTLSPDPIVNRSEVNEHSTSINMSAEPSSVEYKYENDDASFQFDEIHGMDYDESRREQSYDEKYSGKFNTSEDSFALIADYYDDYFRENASKNEPIDNPDLHVVDEEDDDN